MGTEVDKGQEEARRHHEATLSGLYEEYYNKIVYNKLIALIKAAKENGV